jgi:hypothetical protein
MTHIAENKPTSSMNSETCGMDANASVRSSAKRKRSSSTDADAPISKTTESSNGLTRKTLTGRIRGRCQGFEIPMRPVNRKEVWVLPSFVGGDGKAKLRGILLVDDFPFTKDYTSCKYLAEVSENGFEFNLLSVEDVHHIGIPKLECKDDWVSFQFSGAQIQLHSSKPLNGLALIAPCLQDSRIGLGMNLGQ